MKIQLANYQYTGSYAKLRNAGNKSFPYSVKVEGFGTSKTKGSLFDFASVSITEHFEKDKYEILLPFSIMHRLQALPSESTSVIQEDMRSWSMMTFQSRRWPIVRYP